MDIKNKNKMRLQNIKINDKEQKKKVKNGSHDFIFWSNFFARLPLSNRHVPDTNSVKCGN